MFVFVEVDMLQVDGFFRAIVCVLYVAVVAFTVVAIGYFAGWGFAAIGGLIETLTPLLWVGGILIKASAPTNEQPNE